MPKTTKTAKTPTLVGSICLYGAHHCGAGWIASHKGGMTGDGELHPDRTSTTAIWQAAEALRKAGVDGAIVIHAPGGEHYAIAHLGRRIPTFGDLTWHRSGPGVVVSAEQILAASAR